MNPFPEDQLPDSFPLPPDAVPPLPVPSMQKLAPEDFYMEGPNLVFTAAYHIKRGICCNSGCRHCPYGHSG